MEDRGVAPGQVSGQQEPAAKVRRLAEELRFRAKEAMAQRGGSEAFLHWLRSDDESAPGARQDK